MDPKIVRMYADRVKKGDLRSEAFIPKDLSLSEKMTQARNLAGEALADQVLTNTGVPIPGKGSTKAQIEDFLGRLSEEHYPELENDIRIKSGLSYPGMNGEPQKALGLSYIGSPKIELDADMVKKSPREAVATLLHEKGHQYDDKIRRFVGNPNVTSKKVKEFAEAGIKLDPTLAYELGADSHHDFIPDLREGSFELGALKSYLKSGKFKALAGMAGPAATAAGALLAGSPVDAMAEAIPGGVENVGEGSDRVLTPEQNQSVEASRELTGGANLNQARLQALQKMLRR